VGGEEMLTTLIYYDELTDLAVLVVPDITGADPMKLRPLREKNLKIGQDVLYSGYPNLSGLLTIEGYIAGIHPRGDIYMHSYGWSGASGSAVFDTSGRLVGVLVALDVGQGYAGMPSIIEDVVVVVPIWKLNFELLDLNLEV
jgi:S1-C subfamily serine protease